MKANELMVGDWVELYGTPTRWEIEDYAKWYKEMERTDVHTFEPIPLTAEILEKNGWKWNTFHTMIEFIVGTIHIGWGFYKDCISVSDHSDEGHCQISSLRCVYVHELQHALRLCGIDKKIVL